MVDIKRKVTCETDGEYLGRTFSEAHNELQKVRAAVYCSSFTRSECVGCPFYDKENVEYMKSRGVEGERCRITLAVNHIEDVVKIANKLKE